MPHLRAWAKIARIPERDAGDFIGEVFSLALSKGVEGEAFHTLFTSRAIGWRRHGGATGRGSASKIERRAIRDSDADRGIYSHPSGDVGEGCIGSLAYRVDALTILIAREGISMVDRIPSNLREALVASLAGLSELPGVNPVLFRKRVSLARKALGEESAADS